MKKLLFIAPHLSTGGLPQFLLKKIKCLIDQYDVHCIEYSDVTGGKFIVQRDQIKNICKSKFYTMYDNKEEIINLISKIKPDIIHFEEMPEYFMDQSIASKIYDKDRKYYIVETSHDSSFNSDNKRVFPDKFLFVSNYQKQNVKKLPVSSEVIEYPIEVKSRKNRNEGLNFLGLDPSKKHVMHVGLFTPRKNQKEFIEYARAMENENVQFHCIGNMADNFKYYWEPLINDLPKNVKLWGERKDVHNFYSCMDLFLFTSRGHANDKETAPIVIKEAIAYNIPSLFYNLPVYLDRYSCYDVVSYLDELSFNNNIELIRNKLTGVKLSEPIENKDFLAVISTHPNYKIVEDTTIKAVQQIQKAGYKVILTSHFPVSNDLQSLVDYYVYDKNNPMILHNFYANWTLINQFHDIRVHLPSCGANIYHGVGVALNYYNGISLANKLGYKNVFAFNYDVVISDKDFGKLEYIKNLMKTKKGFFFYDKALEGDTFKTVFHAINTEFYLENFEYFTPSSYEKFVKEKNISNGLEQVYYNKLLDYKKDLYIDTANNEESFFNNSNINMFSMCEYLSVLPMTNNPNKFVCISSFNNKVDKKYNRIVVYKNDIVIHTEQREILSDGWWHIEVDFEPNNEYKVINTLYESNIPDWLNKLDTARTETVLKEVTHVFNKLEDLKNNGHFTAK